MTHSRRMSVILPAAPAVAAALACLLGMACQRTTLCPKGWKEARAGDDGIWCRQGDRAQYHQVHLPSRRPRQSCEFVAGRLEGPFKAWHPAGQRWIEGRYQEGQLQGSWQQWDEQGGKVAEAEYREGRMVSGAPVAVASICPTVKP